MYYMIMLVIMLIGFCLQLPGVGLNVTIVNSIDRVTVIFLMIAGLCSFKDEFYFLIQNGVARKTIFKVRVYNAIAIGAVFAVGDQILYGIVNLLSRSYAKKIIWIFQGIYPTFAEDLAILRVIVSLLFYVALYALITMFGYVISLMYFRLDKLGKTLVSIIAGMGIIIGLPWIDMVTNGALSWAYEQFIYFALGVETVMPLYGIITFLI